MAEADTEAPGVVQAGEVQVRRALLSVSDKRGLVDFARGLAQLGVEIISTGGTARELAEAGIETRPVDDYTGFPEILDGRVKTLNPKIYAGLLAVRSNEEHMRTIGEHEIEHELLPRAVRLIAAGGVEIVGRQVMVRDGGS